MNFESIFEDLRIIKVSQADVLKMVIKQDIPCSQVTINKIARGKTKDPGYSLGHSIVEIHHKLCPGRA